MAFFAKKCPTSTAGAAKAGFSRPKLGVVKGNPADYTVIYCPVHIWALGMGCCRESRTRMVGVGVGAG